MNRGVNGDCNTVITAFLIKLFNELKGPLSSLRQFLTNERPLKKMKNVFFFFMLKALFVLQIFKFLP